MGKSNSHCYLLNCIFFSVYINCYRCCCWFNCIVPADFLCAATATRKHTLSPRIPLPRKTPYPKSETGKSFKQMLPKCLTFCTVSVASCLCESVCVSACQGTTGTLARTKDQGPKVSGPGLQTGK